MKPYRLRRMLAAFMPGMNYARCGRCHLPWWISGYHVTDFTETRGCFPLCNNCWYDLVPRQRLPYYRKLFEQWSLNFPESQETWELMKRAVEEGR